MTDPLDGTDSQAVPSVVTALGQSLADSLNGVAQAMQSLAASNTALGGNFARSRTHLRVLAAAVVLLLAVLGADLATQFQIRHSESVIRQEAADNHAALQILEKAYSPAAAAKEMQLITCVIVNSDRNADMIDHITPLPTLPAGCP